MLPIETEKSSILLGLLSNEQLCSCQVFLGEVMSLRDRHRNEELNEMTWKKHIFSGRAEVLHFNYPVRVANGG